MPQGFEPPATFLTLHTSTVEVSFTWVKDGRIQHTGVRSRHEDGGPAAWLAPWIHETLGPQGWAGLEALCVTRGPGSLTGIRIGLSFAHGIAFAQKIPLWGTRLFPVWRYHLSVICGSRFPDQGIAVNTYGALWAVQYVSGRREGQEQVEETPQLVTPQVLVEAIRSDPNRLWIGEGLQALVPDMPLVHEPDPTSGLLAEFMLHHPEWIQEPAEPFYLQPVVARPSSPSDHVDAIHVSF